MKAFLPFLLAFLLCRPAFATSRTHPSPEAMIAGAEAIAIVNAAANKQVLRESGKAPLYHVTTPATRVEVLKGALPAAFAIHHSSGRDDVLFMQGPGQYLVFLKRQGDLLVPSEGWPSAKAIRKGKVLGWNQSHSARETPVELEAVKKQIAQAVSR